MTRAAPGSVTAAAFGSVSAVVSGSGSAGAVGPVPVVAGPGREEAAGDPETPAAADFGLVPDPEPDIGPDPGLGAEPEPVSGPAAPVPPDAVAVAAAAPGDTPAAAVPGPVSAAVGPASLAHRVPDLAALELLLAVARLGSLSGAARERGVSQPAASSRIRSMERQLGVALLDRSPSGSRLTDAGVLVTDWARRVVAAAEAFDAGAQALRRDRDSRLRVAASMTIAEYLLPGWLIALRAERPGTAVSLLAGNSTAVTERLLAAEADLGFVEGVSVARGLDSVVIGHDRLVVVAAPGHPWTRRSAPLTAAELAAAPLILRERGSGTRQVLHAALGGLAPPLIELSSTTAVKAAVASGAGPSVVSELAVGEELTAHRLVEVPFAGPGLRRALRAVWPTGHRPAGPARDLLALTHRSDAAPHRRAER